MRKIKLRLSKSWRKVETKPKEDIPMPKTVKKAAKKAVKKPAKKKAMKKMGKGCCGCS